jgi:hypothetical protein
LAKPWFMDGPAKRGFHQVRRTEPSGQVNLPKT